MSTFWRPLPLDFVAHHAGTAAGCLIVMATKMAQPYLWVFVLSPLSLFFLPTLSADTSESTHHSTRHAPHEPARSYVALGAELNTVFLNLRMILKLLGLGGGGNATAEKAARAIGRRKASRAFSLVVWPLLLATFALTRVFIHGQALAMNLRLLWLWALGRAGSGGGDGSGGGGGDGGARGRGKNGNASLIGALALYGVATGSVICYLNYRLMRRLLRVDGAALKKAWGLSRSS